MIPKVNYANITEDELIDISYALYTEKWCEDHGYDMDYNPPDEDSDDCYACQEEFLDQEYQDEDIMEELLPKSLFKKWKEYQG